MQRNRAGIVIRKMGEDKILVIRRVRDAQEYYAFPGGTIEDGESPAEAAKREAQEELSLAVEIGEKTASLENQGRQETYFWVSKYEGVLALSGDEKEWMNENNQYHLEWKDREEFLRAEPFYPKEMKQRIVAWWKERKGRCNCGRIRARRTIYL